MLVVVLRILSVLLSSEAAFFLAKNGIGLRPPIIANLASTYWGANKHLVRALSKQAADTAIGMIHLMLSLTLALISLIFPTDARQGHSPIIISIAVAAVALGVSLCATRFCARRIEDKVYSIIEERREAHLSGATR